MSFTDSDLKRLKDCIDKGDDLDWMYTIHDGFTDDKLKALLARLETAEAFCSGVIDNYATVDLDGLAEAWLTASGKDR